MPIFNKTRDHYSKHLIAMDKVVSDRERRHGRDAHEDDQKTRALNDLQQQYEDLFKTKNLDDACVQAKLDSIELTFAYVASLSRHFKSWHSMSWFKPSNPAPAYKYYKNELHEQDLNLKHKEVTSPKNLPFTEDLSQALDQQLQTLLQRIDSMGRVDHSFKHPSVETIQNPDKVVHAIDGDGCTLTMEGDDQKTRKLAQAPFKSIKQQARNFEQTHVVSFSARVCPKRDQIMSAYPGDPEKTRTDLFLDNEKNQPGVLSKAFADSDNINVDTGFLLSSVEKGSGCSLGIEHVDEQKLLRVYQIAHHYATQWHNADNTDSFRLVLYDDIEDILNTIMHFYGNNPGLLPDSCQLVAHHNDLAKNISDFSMGNPAWCKASSNIIQGAGPINSNYEESLRLIYQANPMNYQRKIDYEVLTDYVKDCLAYLSYQSDDILEIAREQYTAAVDKFNHADVAEAHTAYLEAHKADLMSRLSQIAQDLPNAKAFLGVDNSHADETSMEETTSPATDPNSSPAQAAP